MYIIMLFTATHLICELLSKSLVSTIATELANEPSRVSIATKDCDKCRKNLLLTFHVKHMIKTVQ